MFGLMRKLSSSLCPMAGGFPCLWLGIRVSRMAHLRNKITGSWLVAGAGFIGRISMRTLAWKIFSWAAHREKVKHRTNAGSIEEQILKPGIDPRFPGLMQKDNPYRWMGFLGVFSVKRARLAASRGFAYLDSPPLPMSKRNRHTAKSLRGAVDRNVDLSRFVQRGCF